MTTWLQIHHKDQVAVIFYEALLEPSSQRIAEMKKRFGEELSSLVGAEFAVLVCATFEEADRILRETPKYEPYTLVWDGSKITGHH